MNLESVSNSLPPDVALVVLDGSMDRGVEIFAEEEGLLSPRALPRRVAEFRLGRHAAHLALVQIGREPQPVLAGSNREPLWPSGVVGSITHSGNAAIALVGDAAATGGLGIDLEDRDRYFPGLEARIAREDERALLERMRPEHRTQAVLEIFSAKETIYKAFFPRVGRYFGFMTARVEQGPDGLVGHFTEPIDSAYPIERPIEIGRQWIDESVLTWLVLPTD